MKKEYRISRKLIVAIAAMFIIMEIYIGYYVWGVSLAAPYGKLLASFSLVPLLIGVPLVASLLKTKICISDEKIAYYGLIKSRELLLSGIKGFRSGTGRDRNTITIFPKDSSAGVINIVSSLNGHGELKDWIKKNLVDLDKKEKEKKRKAILEDRELGGSEKERLDKLSGARKIALGLNIFSVAAGIAAFVFLEMALCPPVYPTLQLKLLVVLCSALPLVAVIVNYYSKGLVMLEYDKNSERPGLIVTLIVPLVVLSSTYNSDYIRFLSFFDILKPVAVVMAVMFCIFYLSSQKAADKTGFSSNYFAGVLVYLLLYSLTFVMTTNWVFDPGTPAVYRPEVIEMSEVKTSKGSNFYLTVDKWGPVNEQETLKVDYDAYSSLKDGGKFRIYLYNGLYKVPYYTY